MTTYVLLVGVHLLCHYDLIFATVTSVVAVFLYLWQSGYFSCANKDVLAPTWMHLFCPYDCICFAGVTAIVQYDYTIFTAILLLQGYASRNYSWYRACSNNVTNVHGQITIQSYSRIKWNSDQPCVGRYSLAFFLTIDSVLTCKELGAYSSSEHAYMVLKQFFWKFTFVHDL
jgi:hypothetical protein